MFAGLVTSLALAFRVNSAYERYSEGRYVQSFLVPKHLADLLGNTGPSSPK